MTANTTTPPLDAGTRLAVTRTQLAEERTLMAWVRTAMSLISFGFTIYKFFDFEAGRAAAATSGLFSPRVFAVVMIGTGLIALLLSTLDHRQQVTRFSEEFGTSPRPTTAGIMASIVAVMGVSAFIAVVFHV